MEIQRIADTLAKHRAQADSWSWWCSCSAGQTLSTSPMGTGANPGMYRQADHAARAHVAEVIARG